jgi:hypothetical protein
MDRASQHRLAKALVFAGFIACFLAFGAWNATIGNPPTQWGGKPYMVSPFILSRHPAAVEGELVSLIDMPENVAYNASTDVLVFDVLDELNGITIVIIYPNWSGNGVYTTGDIASSLQLVVVGISHFATNDTIQATKLIVIGQENVFAFSIIGAIAILAVLFWYFRLDLRHLRFTDKARPSSKEGDTHA